MNTSTIFQFYKESYEAQFERKAELIDSIGIVLAVLAIIGGLLSYYVAKLDFSTFEFLDLAFYLPFSIGVLAASSAVAYLYRAICHSYYYRYIPKTDDIKKTLDLYSAYQDSAGDKAMSVEDFFFANLEKQYCEYAARNFEVNMNRSGHLFAALQSAMIATMFLLMSFPGFYIYQKNLPLQMQHVELKAPVTVDIIRDGSGPQKGATNVRPESGKTHSSTSIETNSASKQ